MNIKKKREIISGTIVVLLIVCVVAAWICYSSSSRERRLHTIYEVYNKKGQNEYNITFEQWLVTDGKYE